MESDLHQRNSQCQDTYPIQRDNLLDTARALIMIYIICWIHGMYWYNMGSPFSRSFLLFEMPIIFYISGASFTLCRPKKTGELFLNRFKRVMIPYYIYVVLWIMAVFVWNNSISLYPKGWFKTIIGESFRQAPFQSHIWFILPYMVITCSFPLQRAILSKIPALLYLVAITIIFMIIYYADINHSTALHILCYNIFFILGYVSYHKWKINKAVLIGGGSLLVFGALFHTGTLTCMQSLKFPPHPIFILFGLGWVSILCATFPLLKLNYSPILKIWNKHGYTLYLYQSIPLALYTFFPQCRKLTDSGIGSLLIVAVSLFLINTALLPIVIYIETKVYSVVIKLFTLIR